MVKIEFFLTEELVEQKRAELSAQNKSLTPITLQTFVAWKKRKLREKKAKEQKENEDKKKKMKQGFTVGMSGRDMFMFDPKMVSNEVKKKNFKINFLDLAQSAPTSVLGEATGPMRAASAALMAQ